MNITPKVFTHVGWLLACPIRLADVDLDAPEIEPRSPLLRWWLGLNVAACGFYITVRSFFSAAYVPAWPILITGQVQ